MASTVGARSAKPRCLLIADDIEGQIKGGSLAPAEEIPSETALIARYGVASGTARKAVAQLRAMGFVLRGRPFALSRPADPQEFLSGTSGRVSH